jgi:hypothetical protein
VRPLPNDDLGRIKKLALHDCFERSVGSDPHVRIIVDALPFQLKRSAIPNVVADIFLINKNLMDSASCPFSPHIGPNVPGVEKLSDLAFALAVFNKRPINPTDGFLFFLRTWN